MIAIRREIEHVQRGFKRGHLTFEERNERLMILSMLHKGQLGPRYLIEFEGGTGVVEASPHRVRRGKRSPSV